MYVKSIRFCKDKKIFKLSNGRQIETHRYCCLSEGNRILFRRNGNAEVCCRNGHAKVFPIYKAKDSITFGKRVLKLTIKEIETASEINGYHKLEECHYRGKVLHGRRIPLIVTSDDPLLPEVLGYVELATAFLMNRPRTLFLNDAFKESKGEIEWKSWDKETTQKYTNLIVRIARTVVSPEFRGLGLARLLVKHAARFAREHWHVGNLKPLFIEITADMLRYVPFVESAGMHYIGDTEGNLDRVSKDMRYILKNFSRVKKREILNGAGIVDLQVSYAESLKKIGKTQGVKQEHLLNLLLHSPEKLSDDNWAMLHRIFRLPKPTFLMGITPAAKKFVKKQILKLNLPHKYPVKRPAPYASLSKPIELKSCSLKLTAPLIKTRSTRKVQQAFGVNRDMLSATLFSDINLTISPGNIVLICGPSGAGKTTLLSLLTQQLIDPKNSRDGFAGKIEVPRAKVSTLSTLTNSRPLVNALGNVSFEHALSALNVSGLAEAHLYIKRFQELSNGQRYRAMVAKLIASGADVWMADEFCATLDPITANIVSRNLRRCAKDLGITVILAAANWSEFIHELRPDTILHLRAPWDYKVFKWKEFERAVLKSKVISAS